LLRDVRLNAIVDALRDAGVRSTAELAGQFGVSEMTLRRDLDHLGRQGLVRRVHGGARAAAGADPGYHRRAEENAAAKPGWAKPPRHGIRMNGYGAGAGN